MKTRTITLGLFTSVAASVASPTWAQTAPTPADAPLVGEQQRRRGGLEEVVVTAQRRSERLQDVPVSITAITAEDISSRGLVGAADYLRGVPSVNQVEAGYGGQVIIIRGLETATGFQNFGGGTTTATYFGETSVTNSAGLVGSGIDIKLVDIERVEVLRGPQGTAFGDSSMGGAVRIIPQAPKLINFEGNLAASYSLTSGSGGDNNSIQAVGNIPLIKDKLALRATAYQYNDSGFYRNVAGSDAAFQSAVVAPFGAQAFAANQDHVGDYNVVGGRIAALFQATKQLQFTLSYLTQRTETDDYALANSGRYEQTLLGVAPEHIRRGQSGGFSDGNIDLINGVMEFDLGWADVLATYSHIKSGEEHAVPWGVFNANFPVSFLVQVPHREDMGEVRLVTKLNGSWNFIAGVHYDQQDDWYSSDWIWFGDPATNFFSPPNRDLLDYEEKRGLRQLAAFSEVFWQVVEDVKLTVGARRYDYDRTVRVDQSGPLIGGGSSSTDLKTDATGTNYRANVSYKPKEDAMVYVGWAQGFRLGRPQPPIPAAACDLDGNGLVDGTNYPIAATGHLDSDSVNSYELGTKLALVDRKVTIEAAVFRMDWSDLPVAVVGAQCAYGFSSNAGEARSRGVEFQVHAQVTDALRASIGGSWVDAKLTQDASPQGLSKDQPLPGAPKESLNVGVEYVFSVAGNEASVRADSIYVGPYSEVTTIPDSASGDYVKLDASARVQLRSFSLEFFGRNLTNESAYTLRDAAVPYFGYRLRPRTLGVQLGYSF